MSRKKEKKEKKDAPYYEVRKSSIHSWGVFAARDIPKGKKIVQYKGKKLSKSYCEKKDVDDTYLFELNDKYNIDGKNDARYANHSCDPNCETEIIRGEIWIISLRKIKKGEELVYNYGYEIEEGVEFNCECGSEKCTGFILGEESWPAMKRIMKLVSKRMKQKKL